MVNIVTPRLKPALADESYEYLLAVSTDSLYVLSSDKQRILESIIDGKDTEGWMFSCDNENDFLDAIIDIKRDILSGINPLDYLL